MRRAKSATSCGKEIEFFRNFVRRVFRTVTKVTDMWSKATNMESVKEQLRKSSANSWCGNFHTGSMQFR